VYQNTRLGTLCTIIDLVFVETTTHAPPNHSFNTMMKQIFIFFTTFFVSSLTIFTHAATEMVEPNHSGRKLSDIGVCSGLNIANVAEDEATSDDQFIMRDGQVSENWNGKIVNMATADEEVREFYMWKTGGTAVYFDNVTVSTANPQHATLGKILSPTLDNDGDQSFEVSTTKAQGPVGEGNKAYTAHLRYGRCFRYGQPYVWITFEAWNTRGKDKENGYNLLKSCGLSKSNCKGKVCLRFTLLWAKQCPPQRSPQLGLNVGTSPNSVNIVYNGETKDAFDPGSPSYYILKDTMRSVLYFNYDKTFGRNPITLGKPSVQGFADNQLVITQSGTLGRGAQLIPGVSDQSMASLDINFKCKPDVAPSTQRITVGIDICVDGTPVKDCSLQNSEFIAAQSLKFSVMKYCLHNPSHNWGLRLFILFVVVTFLSCIFGCMFNWKVNGHRDLEVIPGVGMIRQCLSQAHRKGMLAKCPSWMGFSGLKYQTLNQMDDDDDSDIHEAADGLQQDSSFSYQENGSATIRINMPRKHGSGSNSGGGNGLQLDDPFADIPVDDDDDLADFLSDEEFQ
jgi:hypothetical protein